MKQPLSIDQLKRLKVIMQMMLSEANNANWQELSRLDSERRVLIDFDAAVLDEHKDAVEPESAERKRSLDRQTEYQALSNELVAIDEEISNTVQKARQALLEQTRGLKAQVSAKKEYEQVNTMKVSSYN